jgi:hypothetical protein
MKQERDLETTCSTFSVDLYPIIHCGSKDHILNRVRNLYIIIDADMATMHMYMRGAWIGEDGVQQGFPSREGGPRLIRFESPRWRQKAI